MIRQLAIIAVATVYFILSTTATPVTDENEIIEAKKWIHSLEFNNFDLDKIDKKFVQKAINFDWEAEIDGFEAEYKAIVRKFLRSYTSGSLLPRDQLFSIYYHDLRKEAILIFKLFYNAPITKLPYIATWAYIHLNEYLMKYAFAVALVQRIDTSLIPIPRPYQQIPEYYFDSIVMKQVYDYKISLANSGEDEHTHVIVSNNTNWYSTHTNGHETYLHSFMEDVELNAWYYYATLRFPEWLSSGEHYPNLHGKKRGEWICLVFKILYNRYLMERHSFGLDEPNTLDWTKPVLPEYIPNFSYPNGRPLLGRGEDTKIPICKNDYVEQIREIEFRLGQVADSGYFMNKDGKFESFHTENSCNSFCNLLLGNNDSLNLKYYGSLDFLYRHVLGSSPAPHSPHQIFPSALDIPETNLKDPAFYLYIQKFLNYIWRYRAREPYTEQELAFDGIAIKSANVVGNSVYSYNEPYDVLVDRFTHSDNKKMTKIKVRKYRLNHEPFALNMSIDSDYDVEASIHTFIGFESNKRFSEKYKNFYPTDCFTFNLKKGLNTIIRSSKESSWCVSAHEEEETSENFVEGTERVAFEHRRFGFPCHMLYPTGTVDGMPVKLFVYVSKSPSNSTNGHEFTPESCNNQILGYPLDKPLANDNMPNMFVSKFKIYWKN